MWLSVHGTNMVVFVIMIITLVHYSFKTKRKAATEFPAVSAFNNNNKNSPETIVVFSQSKHVQ